MRNKIFRNITVYFLWVAGLAVNAHMIIPHDHHQVDTVAGQEDPCPVSNSKTDHHSGFPVHCHFCNDLTSEKAVTLLVYKNIQCKYFVAPDLFILTAFKPNDNGIQIFEFTTLPFKSDIPDLSRFRAPPSLG